MSAIYLDEDDVRRLLTMEEALDAVEAGLRSVTMGEAENIARRRARTDGTMLHLMGAASRELGLLGFKAYSTTPEAARFHVMLYDGESGEMLAVIAADHLGRIRTGAASGVATEYMARPDASVVGVFGTGRQARTQVQAVCAVRKIQEVRVFSPVAAHRERFAAEMRAVVQAEIKPVHTPQEAAEDMDIIITATASRVPVLDGHWVCEGTHINAAGSNFRSKAEIDPFTVARCSQIIVDSLEAARIEAGDLVEPIEKGSIHWSQIHELGEVIVGRQTGRAEPAAITLFKSVGLAIEDLAVGAVILRKARAAGLGRPLPW